MANEQYVNIPGYKASKGIQPNDPLIEGEYLFEIQKVEPKPLRNNAPGVRMNATLKVLEGPPQKDGKAAKNRIAWASFDIKDEKHPDMFGRDVTDQISIHEFKSFGMAAGVESKGDNVKPSAYTGLKVRGKCVHSLASDGSGREFVNIRNWKAAE